MKRPRKEDVRKVEEALVAAHRLQEPVQADPAFRRELMEHIRGLGPTAAAERKEAPPWLVPVWRFAAVTCVVCILLFFYALNTETSLDFEVAEAIAGAPSNLVIAQAFGGI